MTDVKIRFSIEIDGIDVIHHIVQRNEKRTDFDLDRTLALEIINRLNTLYTDRDIFYQPWKDLEPIKNKADNKNIPFSMKKYL
ncbi:hypothetical protein [Exercitatus varius]|uniref:hypothetical protein n=1 Tax=Exercitatus varius TaxID=67857 RepID=UPI00294B89BD|nr:hypothetical protein [Exercitatus varius]MDG2961739.1 hypothetical protein [Exercitatus varius]